MTGLRTEEYKLSKVSEDRQDVSLWAPPQLGATQSSIARDWPTQFSVNTQATADLNSSGARPIGEIEGTAPDASFACGREMRIDKRDRIALSVAPDLDIKRRRIAIMTGAAKGPGQQSEKVARLVLTWSTYSCRYCRLS